MDRPKVTGFIAPCSLDEIPLPIAYPGILLQNNAGFRTERPVMDHEKCVECMMCYLLCPEGTIYRDEKGLAIDYDFCKGCGICVCECKPGALNMVSEMEVQLSEEEE
jgi:pyruvate ferredoxin oxidoreductase delta subunit